MNKQYLPYFVAILVVFLIIGPGIAGAHSRDQCTNPDGYRNLTAIKAHKMIEKEDVFILDVRIPIEYDYGHIEGAKLIPLRDAPKIDLGTLPKDKLLDARLKELPHNKHTKILIYCKQGHRGPDACKILVKAGYKNVYNMYDDVNKQGGIDSWVNEGYPIVSDPAKWAANYPHA